MQEIWCSRRSILDKLWDVSSIVSTCKSKQRLLRAQNRVPSHWRYLNPPQKSFIMQSKCHLFERFSTFVQKSGRVEYCNFWKSKSLQFSLTNVWCENVFHFAEPFKEMHMRIPQGSSLTRLTRLNHTLFLPSKWNLYSKIQFWPKIDGEKWSRKNSFDIPPCRRLLSLTSLKCPKSQIQY